MIGDGCCGHQSGKNRNGPCRQNSVADDRCFRGSNIDVWVRLFCSKHDKDIPFFCVSSPKLGLSFSGRLKEFIKEQLVDIPVMSDSSLVAPSQAPRNPVLPSDDPGAILAGLLWWQASYSQFKSVEHTYAMWMAQYAGPYLVPTEKSWVYTESWCQGWRYLLCVWWFVFGFEGWAAC